MADVPAGPAVEVRLRDFLAAELRQAELDFAHLPRRARPPDRRRLPFALATTGLAILALVVIVVPRLSDRGAIGVPPASSPTPNVASASVVAVPSQAPTATPSAATGVIVDCGRISPEACATAIDLVRAEHEAEVVAATRIVMDDTCAPARRLSDGTVMTTICDRMYPFSTIVVLVTAGGDTTGWYAFSVVGLEYDTPTTVEPWVGDIPPHVLRTLTKPPPAP